MFHDKVRRSVVDLLLISLPLLSSYDRLHMASDLPPADGAVRVRKRRQKRESEHRRKDVHEFQEVQEENIKELTVVGHKALQEGRNHDALRCFNQAVKAAVQVRLQGTSSSTPGCLGTANSPP